jgi:SP family sugar:H+ symporter-like MFS transporter
METTRTSVNVSLIGMIVAVATIGGLLFGYDSGAVNGTQSGLTETFGLSDWSLAWTVGSLLLGCAAGAFFAGRMADAIGRRTVMILAAMLFVVGALVQGWTDVHAIFVVARFAGGMAVGAASVLSPLYISEVAPANIRGRLTTVQQVMIITGLTAAFVVNYFLAQSAGSSLGEVGGLPAWRWMYLAQAVPAVVFLVALFFIPESPRYLVSKGRSEEARQVLTRLFGPAEADRKIGEIEASFSKDHRPSFRDVAAPGTIFRPIVWAGIMLATFQQFVGINIIFYYGETLWRLAGISEEVALERNIISGVVSIAAVLAALAVIDKIGRKPLLLIGSAGMAVTLGAMAWAFSGAQSGGLRRARGRQPLRDLLQLLVGPGHVGHARRDVPQPDARLGAGGRGPRAMGCELPRRPDLPADGERAGPCQHLPVLHGQRGDQHLPGAEVHPGDQGQGTGRDGGLIRPDRLIGRRGVGSPRLSGRLHRGVVV